MNNIKNKYDVIIIGAGIGGLVCGCYLARNGIKTLIVEQQSRVGGYCGSFSINNNTFDIGVHYLGKFAENSFMSKVWDDLKLSKYITISRFDPTDIIIFPDFKLCIRNDINKTIEDLKILFPSSRSDIENFFSLILKSDFNYIYANFRKKTMRYILNKYFNNKKIISIFEILLGNIGLPSRSVSAVAAFIMFRDYVFNGGYYPKGGMQKFSEAFSEAFKKNGGTLVLNKRIERVITTRSGFVDGVEIDGAIIKTKYVVLNTFSKSLSFGSEDNSKIKLFTKKDIPLPSCSAFIVYFSLKGELENVYKEYHNVWYSQTYDVDLFYHPKGRGVIESRNFIFFSLPSLHDSTLKSDKCETGHLLMLTHYNLKEFLNRNSQRIAKWLIAETEKFACGISSHIKIEAIATPTTFEKYTSNYNGALYGWASTPSQCHRKVFSINSKLRRVSVVGHWVTLDSGQGGITMSAYTGKLAARDISKELRK